MLNEPRNPFGETLDSDEDIDLSEIKSSGIELDDSESGPKAITAVIAQYEESGDPVRAAFLSSMRETVVEAQKAAVLARAALKAVRARQHRQHA
jgi:hypothetical protein